jgi:hypothetical protein
MKVRGQVVGAVALIMLAAIIVIIAQSYNFNMLNALENFLGLGDGETEVVDTKLIVLGIKDLALLETARSDIMIEQTAARNNRFSPDSQLKIR